MLIWLHDETQHTILIESHQAIIICKYMTLAPIHGWSGEAIMDLNSGHNYPYISKPFHNKALKLICRVNILEM